MIQETVQYQPGDKMEDGSYYMGVSPTTGTDFYLFIENATGLIRFNEATELLKKNQISKKMLHGHGYSKQQLESDIVEAYQNNLADGGIRRLTKEEQTQAYAVLESSELKKLAIEVCSKTPFTEAAWIQSASPCNETYAWQQSLHYGNHVGNYKCCMSSILLGRSEPN